MSAVFRCCSFDYTLLGSHYNRGTLISWIITVQYITKRALPSKTDMKWMHICLFSCPKAGAWAPVRLRLRCMFELRYRREVESELPPRKTRAEYCGCFATHLGVGNRGGNSTSILWLALSLLAIASSAVLPLLYSPRPQYSALVEQASRHLWCFRSFLAAEAVTCTYCKYACVTHQIASLVTQKKQ